MIDLVRRAGQATLPLFRSLDRYELKGDESPVTAADVMAERMIREALEKEFPSEPILGEEEGGSAEITPTRWVLDPIDGTKAFIAGVPTYATLLAYEVEGVPTHGAVYLPALDELFAAELGAGATLNGNPIRVSKRNEIKGSILACGGLRSMIEHDRWPPFAEMSMVALATRSWSDAFGHMMVAKGRVDAMIDPVVSRWDLSAVRIIVEEAGGLFSDFAGGDPFAKGDFGLEAISANPHLHPALIAAYRK